jgi:hypothetical protein
MHYSGTPRLSGGHGHPYLEHTKNVLSTLEPAVEN